MASKPYEFYVYTLSDPRTGLPFYVGKGSGRRAWSHESAVRRGNFKGNAKKAARIKEILDSGATTDVAIVQEYEYESDAFEHEIEMISALVGLLNVLPGGEGACRLTPEQIAARERARAKRIKDRRKAAAFRKSGNEQYRASQSLARSGGRGDCSGLGLWIVMNGHLVKPPKKTAAQSNAELAAFRASKPNATLEEKRWAARTAKDLDRAPVEKPAIFGPRCNHRVIGHS